MNIYLSYFKLRFNVALQYRFSAIAGILTQFFWGMMLIMIYDAYYRNNIPISMDLDSLISYIWLGQSFFLLTRFSCADSDISESIITGGVAYEFTKPVSIYGIWFSRLCANKVAGTILRCLPIILVSIFLPSPYNLSVPASFMSFILFLLTLVLGALLTVGIAMLIYVIMFYTTSSRGLFNVYAVIAEFFAGSVIPIPLMPEFLQKICYLLPFRLSFDLPFRIYTGNISVSEGIVSVIIQLVWLAVIVFCGSRLINRSAKKLVIHGG